MSDPMPPSPASPTIYPVRLEVETPERIANWRPLVQWFLAIPHLVLASILTYAAQILSVVAWFIVVFTGNLPAGLAKFFSFIIRYSQRVSGYAGFLHDTYPPFEFDITTHEPGDHPVRVEVDPQLEDRNRLTVGLRFIWVIPIGLVTAIIGFIGMVCWFLGFFAVLFTGRWPEGLRAWVLRALRASLRLNAYLFLLTDEYPPFSFD